MTQVDLKKTTKYAVLGFLVCAVLFTVGAWQTINGTTALYEKTITRAVFGGEGFNASISWFLLLLVLFAVLMFWLRTMKKKQVTGKKSLGLFIIMTFHKYRFLLEQLVLRDFKIKYKRSILGVFWSFLNPLLMMSVQYIVFSKIFNVRGAGIEHYAIYLLCGIVIWGGFNDCATQSMRSIMANSHLITKVYVPKYIYPISKVLSAFINVILSMVPLLLVTVVYGLFSDPHLFLKPSVLLLPFALILLLLFVMGIGFVLSTLMVFFHDIEFLWGVFSMVWMYATPIIYSLSMFNSAKADWVKFMMNFNPLYHYIDFVRAIIMDGVSPSFAEMGICLGFSLLSFFLGALIFKKNQDRFILYL